MIIFDGRIGRKLSKDIVASLRFFGYYIGNGTLLLPDKTDMAIIYESSNALGNLYAIKIFYAYDRIGNYVGNNKKEGTSPHPLRKFIKCLHEKKPFDLPASIDQIKKGLNWRYVISRFMLDLGNRNLETIPLKKYTKDYTEDIIDYGSGLEMVTALFCNILRMDHEFNVINEDWARYRTSQYIRSWADESYIVKPSFKNWETTLWI